MTKFVDSIRRGLEKALAFAEGAADSSLYRVHVPEATKLALRGMIDLIVARSALPRVQADPVCSLAVDLGVTLTVNGEKGVYGMLEKELLFWSRIRPDRRITPAFAPKLPVYMRASKETPIVRNELKPKFCW